MTLKKDTGYNRYALEYAALGLLTRGPRHGYGLYQEFVTHFDKIWSAGQTNFYLALSSAEDKGLITFAGMEPQRTKPPRKLYSLTATGREEFMRWLHQPVDSLRAVRVELVSKLRFFDLLDLPDVQQLLDRQIELLETMIHEWAAQPVEDHDTFYPLVLDFRIRQARAIVEWLESVPVSAIPR